MQPKHSRSRCSVYQGLVKTCQIRAVITLPCKAAISGLSLSVASAHKQGGDESGSVGGQEVVFRGQHYLRRVQTMRSHGVVVGLFSTFKKKAGGGGTLSLTRPYGPATGCYSHTHTHVQKLAVCMQGAFNSP